ncbi:unnamed protein product, partial [Protopolystoma xenopodis]
MSQKKKPVSRELVILQVLSWPNELSVPKDPTDMTLVVNLARECNSQVQPTGPIL